MLVSQQVLGELEQEHHNFGIVVLDREVQRSISVFILVVAVNVMLAKDLDCFDMTTDGRNVQGCSLEPSGTVDVGTILE